MNHLANVLKAFLGRLIVKFKIKIKGSDLSLNLVDQFGLASSKMSNFHKLRRG